MVRIRTQREVRLGRWGSSILFGIIGFIFLAIGAYMFSNTVKISNNGIPTEAEVVKVETRRMTKKTVYQPVIEFTTDEGKLIKVELDSTTTSPSYTVGDKIRIIYSPENPSKVLVDSLFDKYVFPLILAAAGIVSLGAGTVKVIRG